MEVLNHKGIRQSNTVMKPVLFQFLMYCGNSIKVGRAYIYTSC